MAPCSRRSIPALAAEPEVADKIRDGKVQAAAAIVGAGMKATSGRADAARVRELILERRSAGPNRPAGRGQGLRQLGPRYALRSPGSPTAALPSIRPRGSSRRRPSPPGGVAAISMSTADPHSRPSARSTSSGAPSTKTGSPSELELVAEAANPRVESTMRSSVTPRPSMSQIRPPYVLPFRPLGVAGLLTDHFTPPAHAEMPTKLASSSVTLPPAWQR